MLDLKIIEELRTKEELIEYFKQLGKEITEEEIIALKQSYEQADENRDELSLQQLDDVVGGVFVHIVKSGGIVSIDSKVDSIFRFKDGEQINNGGLSRLFDLGYTQNFSVAKTSATQELSEKELELLEKETLQIAHYDANGNFAFETINLKNYNAHLNQDQVGKVILVATEVLGNGNIYISLDAKENLCRFLVHNSDVRNEWMQSSFYYKPAVQPTVPAPPPPAQMNRLPSVVTPNNTQPNAPANVPSHNAAPNAQAPANASLPTGAFGGNPFIQQELKSLNSNLHPIVSRNIDYSVFNPTQKELEGIGRGLVGGSSNMGNSSSSLSAADIAIRIAVCTMASGIGVGVAAGAYALASLINNKNKGEGKKVK